MFEAKNISFSYPDGTMVFRNLNFTVNEGEVISIVGPSGAGKSTLLNCISTKLQLSEGSLYLNEVKVLGPEEKLMKSHYDISIIDQSFEHDEFFTIRENINGELLHLTKSDREQFLNQLLDVFQLQKLADVKSGKLSGGEKQRLSMACALAKEPSLLLLDEPFVHLDVHLNRSIGKYIRDLAKLRSMKVILVTHQGEDALSWSDRIWFFKSGKLKSKYTPEQAYFKPKSLYEGMFFGELNSVYFENKQKLFRPVDYKLNYEKGLSKIEVKFQSSDFRGHYYANFFKLSNNKSIVLYSQDILSNQKQIYV
ncbi:MAG: ABC transporter ATP-binding protein [Brumimicrobium sp.]